MPPNTKDKYHMRDFIMRVFERSVQGLSAGFMFAIVWFIVTSIWPNSHNPLDVFQSTSILSSQYRIEAKIRSLDSVLTVHEWNMKYYADAIDTLRYETEQDSVMRRIRSIESEIMTGPDKALSLPLLRNDVKNIKEDVASLHSTWNTLIALIVTVLIFVAGYNIWGQFKSRPDRTKD